MELDVQKVSDRFSDLLASQQAITTALAALIATHPDRRAFADAFHHHLPPIVSSQAANGAVGKNTKTLLDALETAIRGGYQPPRR